MLVYQRVSSDMMIRHDDFIDKTDFEEATLGINKNTHTFIPTAQLGHLSAKSRATHLISEDLSNKQC